MASFSVQSYGNKQSEAFSATTFPLENNSSSTPPNVDKALSCQDVIYFPSPPNRKRRSKKQNLTPRKLKFKKTIKSKEASIRRLKKINRNKREKLKNIEKTIFANFKFCSSSSRLIAQMQFKEKKRKWTTSEKKLALGLYFRSPCAYRYLRSLNIVLPSISTIRGWLGQTNFSPGFSDKIFEYLGKKFADESNKNKACSILLDEMTIKQCLQYSKKYDVIEGFENLGQLGRTAKIAKSALVFMIRGLYKSWKVPLAYFLSRTPVKPDHIQILFQTAIEKLIQCGLQPKVVISDQGSNNRSAFTKLQVTSTKPYFFCGKEKIIVLFDTPHLLKSLRNNFLNHDFQCNKKIFSSEDLQKTYEIDTKNNTAQALCRLTIDHLEPDNFSKISVKLAAQFFSHSVSSTIKTVIQTGELMSPTAEDTASFIELVNNVFDVLNSRQLFNNNPLKTALTKSTSTESFNILLEAGKCFKSLKQVPTHCRGRCMSRPYCFEGMVQTINGVMELFSDEKEKDEFSHLLTNRLNQDPLENFFSVLRQKGGFNPNPTARTLRTSFRSKCIELFDIDFSKDTNCEPDDDQFLDTTHIIPSEEFKIQNADHNIDICPGADEYNEEVTLAKGTDPDDPDDIDLNSLISEQVENENTLVKNVNSYVAGYALRQCKRKFNCSSCDASLKTIVSKDEPRHTYIMNKTFDHIDVEEINRGLTAPTPIFSSVVDHILTEFENKYFPKYVIKSKIHHSILKELENDDKISSWLNYENCYEHRLFIIKKILFAKIHRKTKLMTAKIASKTTRTTQKKRKLNILQAKNKPAKRKKRS